MILDTEPYKNRIIRLGEVYLRDDPDGIAIGEWNNGEITTLTFRQARLLYKYLGHKLMKKMTKLV